MVVGSSCLADTEILDIALVSSKELLDIQVTIKCGFTVKHLCDMTKTYSQMHRIGKGTHPYPTCHKKRQYDVSFSYPPGHPRNVKRGNENYKFYWNKKILKVVFMFCLERKNINGT